MNINSNGQKDYLSEALDKPSILGDIISSFHSFVLRKGDSVVEIGAGWGTNTWRLLELVGKSGRVWACEFSPARLKNLLHQFKSRGFPNANVIPLLASDEDSITEVYANAAQPGDLQLSPSESSGSPVVILTTRIDRLIPDFHDVHLLSIRLTQGGHLALIGASELLKRTRAPVVFQFSLWNELNRGAFNSEKFFLLFEECNYELLNIFGDEILTFDDLKLPSPWFYVALPREKSSILKKALERAVKSCFSASK
jgi:FkbM family methyltransferase